MPQVNLMNEYRKPQTQNRLTAHYSQMDVSDIVNCKNKYCYFCNKKLNNKDFTVEINFDLKTGYFICFECEDELLSEFMLEDNANDDKH
jgi:uncharacterized CHY-type Zn-finger protein